MNTLLLSFVLSLLACSDNEDPNVVSPTDTEKKSSPPSTLAHSPVTLKTNNASSTATNMDQGQQHPPLPADNPAWDWDAQSFVPDFGWYGEHSWTDVRMRVIGHMAMAYRDLARTHILNGDWSRGINSYTEMVQSLQSIDTASSKFAEQIRLILLKAAQRDLQILRALHTETSFPEIPEDSLMYWRIKYWELVQTNTYDSGAINTIQQQVKQRFSAPDVSAIDDFDNFTDRHNLRAELFEAYTQSLDPLLPADLRWGYWRPTEIQRQANALLMSLEKLKQEYEAPSSTLLPVPKTWWLTEGSTVLSGTFYERLRELHTQNPIFTPSYYSHRLRDSQLDLSPEQLGRLPTGDSIIDVGGQPGPMGIGTLMKLDVSDTEHNAWLTEYGTHLSKVIETTPKAAVTLCKEATATLDAYTHGSRFYNVKQFRNACTRQLARLGHYAEALRIFKDSFPLHHQDWACPNREGLLLVIVGRLEISSGQFDTGIQTLRTSLNASKEFLEKVDQAEQGQLTTPKPPMMSGRGGTPNGRSINNGPPGKPPHGPNNFYNPKAEAPPAHTPHKAGNGPGPRKTNPPSR